MNRRPRIRRGIALASSLVVVGSLVGLTAVLGTGTPAVATGNAPYYLALGDSLSVGWQPYGKVSRDLGHETKQGYANDLYKSYAKQIPGLQLKELGCPGETTGTMINGSCPFNTSYPDGGNQLAEAEHFLRNNDVAFVTIDIGANDVDGCVSDLGNQPALEACVASGVGTIETNLPTILSGLEAADTQGAPIYGMNLYDPFLATYLLPADTGPTGFAEQSVALANTVDNALAATFGAATTPVPVANVEQTFNTQAQAVPSSYTPDKPGGLGSITEPLNVQAVCSYTWECTGYENIHANKLGYSAIALAFEAEIGYLG